MGRFLSGVVVGFVLLLAGCGADPDSGQQPGSSSSSAVSPIPSVENPRDVAAMSLRTCELLTPQQAEGFGLDLPPVQLDGLFGTVDCEWNTRIRDGRVVRRVSISVFTNNPTLDVIYNRRTSFASFDLTAVGGYPAIVARPVADLPICNIDVKPAERQSVSLTYDSDELGDNPQQACEVGKQVAEAVLTNLPLKS
ncbi:MAG: DUF3558 domain-containing protein [Pseudonocardiales bacterium]